MKINAIYNLRMPVRRPGNSPQRVKNPGEPHDFDGVGRPGASGVVIWQGKIIKQ
jgi:hypothetical protein